MKDKHRLFSVALKYKYLHIVNLDCSGNFIIQAILRAKAGMQAEVYFALTYVHCLYMISISVTLAFICYTSMQPLYCRTQLYIQSA